jgi:hypothetical protein
VPAIVKHLITHDEALLLLLLGLVTCCC